jgi:hypothetical protein
MNAPTKGVSAKAEWRRVPISPYRNYEVSSLGEVRRDGRVLVGDVDRYGYRRVLLSYAGLSKRFKVHRLVCWVFRGAPVDGQLACHLDGDPSNNAASNLIWGTHADNVAHSKAHGTWFDISRLGSIGGKSRAGKAAHNRSLTAAEVANIRNARSSGASYRSLAKSFGCSRSAAHRACSGEYYNG